jgi:hypothetical protein
MSSSLLNFASRVLNVDKEVTSFAPIVGLDKADDMTILDSMMLAWFSCDQLSRAISEQDLEVLQLPALPQKANHLRSLTPSRQ